jgi:AcrR family transcriptional regulator
MSNTRVIGRPRSEKSREAILDAAFTLLARIGYDRFTIEAVAAEARAGKTTIYRWWKTKAALAVEAFFHATTDELALPDTVSAQQDFRKQIIQLAGLLRGDRGRAFAAMLGGARSDPVLARELGERWLAPRRQWGLARMTRAQTRGELREGVSVSAALALLYGPLYSPILFGGDVPDSIAVSDYLDLACSAIFAH